MFDIHVNDSGNHFLDDVGKFAGIASGKLCNRVGL